MNSTLPTIDVPLGSTWSSWLLYEGLYYIGLPLFHLGFSLRYEGGKNVPKNGPALIVANHQSFFDPWLVGMATSRHLVYLARKTLFKNPHFAKIIRGLNAVPIDQEGVGKEGIKAVLDQLGRGHAVLVFPEGERCWDGQFHRLKPGIQLLIKRAPVPVVPVGIAGAFDAYPRTKKFPVPSPLFLPASARTLAVSVGKPLDGRELSELPRDRMLEVLFEKMSESVRRAEKLRRK